MAKKIRFLLLLLVMVIPNVVLAEDICVEGNRYNVNSSGKKVNIYQINKDNIDRESMLPKNYFRLKTVMINSKITSKEVNLYLENKESTELTDEKKSSIEKFLKNYESIYKDIYGRYPSILEKAVQGDISEEKEYSFQVSQLNQRCNRGSQTQNGKYEISSCPTKEQYGSNGKYNTLTFQKAIGTFEFNGSGKFNVKMKDLFNGTLLVRVVKNGKNNTEEYDYASIRTLGITGGSDIIYELKSSSITMTFNKGENVRLEFYINPNAGISCSGAYVGYTTFSAPEYAYITNPYKNSTVCRNFKNNDTIPNSYKSVFVPECYNEELEYFSEYQAMNEQTIANKIREKESYFNLNTAASNDISNLQCHYKSGDNPPAESATSTKTYIYNPNNSKYWAASCTETVRVTYDRPKALIAGAGFPYQATLEVERKCTPIAISKIEKPSKCSYKIECWGGPYNHDGDPSAGPNEDFDNCINQCDGGKYTKDCINSCYKSVYEKQEQTYSFLDVAKNIATNMSVKQVANSYSCSAKTSTSPNYCYNQNANWWYKNTIITNINQYQTTSGLTTALGSPIYEIAANRMCDANTFQCTSFHGLVFRYSNLCNDPNNPAVCYEVYTSVPRPECSDNPDEDYKVLETQVNTEYEALVAKLKQYENTEDVTMSIIDSHKTDSNGKLLETTWNKEVKFESGETKLEIKNNVRTESYSNVNYKSIPEIKVTKSYTANLPKAIINAITGEEKYVKENYQSDKDENNAGNKYYTDIRSKSYNSFKYWVDGYAPSSKNYNPAVRIGNNINVIFKNVGTKQTDDTSSYTWNKINIDCFYGLYNDLICEPDDPICGSIPECPPDDPSCDLKCPPNDVCTTGLQYMFRQVNLSNLFPDRNPRWNWNYTTKVGNSYISNASEIIKSIEATGNNAYSHEPEYEFVITRENIQRIRNYNNSAKSYQNYPDMSCSTVPGGTKVCSSKFMSNTSYVKSFRRNTELGQNTNRNR